MEFTEDYPTKPPKCRFPAGFFHPNIYPSGTVCLSILNEELLDTPNPNSPAQSDAFVIFTQQKAEYCKRVKRQALQYPPPS
ncbi:hypothetical protein GPECTOR_120g424 [Gonium pectorale]|uniref:UBC core domain-containing protein n=1 Tax=Gonium pectorale TaxID=33097 RepID=A0A150FYV1_GONPE|nr:hypothetical protein GPECTOR_120g424 [Gonium pectorale]|eukprot:KXZ42757.1 hypothetical protein GPECTOR_120g424 [Gonium pectorale]